MVKWLIYWNWAPQKFFRRPTSRTPVSTTFDSRCGKICTFFFFVFQFESGFFGASYVVRLGTLFVVALQTYTVTFSMVSADVANERWPIFWYRLHILDFFQNSLGEKYAQNIKIVEIIQKSGTLQNFDLLHSKNFENFANLVLNSHSQYFLKKIAKYLQKLLNLGIRHIGPNCDLFSRSQILSNIIGPKENWGTLLNPKNVMNFKIPVSIVELTQFSKYTSGIQ